MSGYGDAGAAADEAAGLEVIGGAQTVLAQQPARADQRAAPQIDRRIQGDRFLAGHLEIEFQMILQILADAGQIVNHRECRARAAPPPARRRTASAAAAN